MDGVRFCRSCKAYATVLDDSGSTQIILFGGWLPALIAAAIGGIVAAFAAGDLWVLPNVVVQGSLWGWLVTVVVFAAVLQVNSYWPLRPRVAETAFYAILLGLGPVNAIAVAIAVGSA